MIKLRWTKTDDFFTENDWFTIDPNFWGRTRPMSFTVSAKNGEWRMIASTMREAKALALAKADLTLTEKLKFKKL